MKYMLFKRGAYTSKLIPGNQDCLKGFKHERFYNFVEQSYKEEARIKEERN